MYTLYGDGIHDDTSAIQSMIDSGVCEVSLPAPKVCYLISRPLELPSNFRLILPRFAEIKLAKNSNCLMLKNKTVDNPNRPGNATAFDIKMLYSPDAPCRNIEVHGGIWNCNNLEQNPNPIYTGVFEPAGYSGFGFLFYNVKNLILSSLTMKDPVNFAIVLDTVSYFTVDGIIFDFNYGNPCAVNMDGVHLNGNCHFGRITNLQGACYDDLVALNSDEGSDGPITNIDICGIFSEDCHSAIRLLTSHNLVKNIHISNIHGTFYQYCVGLTKFYRGDRRGCYDAITIDNVYASKAERLSIYQKDNGYVYPLIFIEGGNDICNLKISELHRREENTPISTIYVGRTAVVENLILSNITTENRTESPEMPLLANDGTIAHLSAENIRVNGEMISL